MGRYFILIDKIPRQVLTVQEYSDWEKTANTNIAFTELVGEVKISTEFMGMEFNWSETPLLFETMIFGGKNDGFIKRYATWEEAERGHKEAVAFAV